MDWYAQIDDKGEFSKHHGSDIEYGYSPSSFSMSYSLTVNRGGYRFTKISVGVNVPTKWEDRDKVYIDAKKFLEWTVQCKVTEVKGGSETTEEKKIGYKYSGVVTLVPRPSIRLERNETVPLGNYESAKVGISWMEASDDICAQTKRIESWIDEKLKFEVEELSN